MSYNFSDSVVVDDIEKIAQLLYQLRNKQICCIQLCCLPLVLCCVSFNYIKNFNIIDHLTLF